MATARPLTLFVALLLALAATGCRRGAAPLTPVQGKVSFKGLPVTAGTIVFTPDTSRGGSGKIAYGKLSADGTYSLSTGDAKGASPGRYRVTVVSLTSSEAPAAGDRSKAPLSLLPEKYRDPDLSDLSCEVKESKTNELNFELN